MGNRMIHLLHCRPMHAQSTLRSSFFYVLLGIVTLLTFFVFRPFIVTLAISATIAVVSQPLYQALLRIIRRVRGTETIATVLTMIAIGILVLAPLSILAMQVIQEATSLYARIDATGTINAAFLTTIETTVEGFVRAYLPSFSLNLGTIARDALQWITQFIGPLFANTLQTLLHFLLGIIALFYLIRDGHGFLRSLIALSPLRDKDDTIILQRLVAAINAIIKGMLLVALIQGIISGIGFAIFGVPSPALWGSVTIIGALIPGVGTASVLAPIVIYLFLSGKIGAAIGMAIWGTVAVSTIDNFLGPLLVGRGVRVHPLFILFAVIGGVQFFGPLGFILGPLVLSLLYALLDIFRVMQQRSIDTP